MINSNKMEHLFRQREKGERGEEKVSVLTVLVQITLMDILMDKNNTEME